MYNEPEYDEEHLRLKRDGRKQPISAGWLFMPALLGMSTSVFLMVVVPSLLDSISSQHSFNRMATEIQKALKEEFTLLANMEWGETNLWIYLLAGAAIGIFIRISFRDEKI